VKPIIRSLIAGAIWGLLPAVVFRWAPWYGVAGVLVSGPLIGAAVFSVSRWAYRSFFFVALWTVPSVYVAAALNGIIVGYLDSIARGGDMILQTFAVTLVGISVPSPLWLIYPVAFVTHLWVRAGANPDRGTVHLENAI